MAERYSLADLLDDRNRQLYEDLAAKVQIELRPSEDSFWREIMKDGVALISHAPSSYPISCFTHELLHVHFDLLGMEHPSAYEIEAQTKKEIRDTEELVREWLPSWYNQLIHQKMYPLFIAMGFPSAEFLDESDAEFFNTVAEHVEILKEKRRKTGRAIPVKLYVLQYLFAKSPHDHSEKTERIRKDLRNLSGGTSYQLDNLIKTLVADPEPNMSWYLVRLFYLCGMPDVAIGRDHQHLIWARDTASGKPTVATG